MPTATSGSGRWCCRGFNEPRTGEAMLEDAERRERSAARRGVCVVRAQSAIRRCSPRLLAALETEQAEFVRPALTRALAAYGADPKVRARMTAWSCAVRTLPERRHRGARMHKATYALQPISEVARLDGPLQDDAVLALGTIGDKRGLDGAGGAAAQAPRNLPADDRRGDLPARHQLRVARRAISSRRSSSASPTRLPGTGAQRPPGWRAGGCGTRTRWRRSSNWRAARDPARAAMALAIGTVALRNPTSCSSAGVARAISSPRRIAARGVRHARGGLRGGALLRHRAAGLLARRRRVRAVRRDRAETADSAPGL